jgi:hypothetical protein
MDPKFLYLRKIVNDWTSWNTGCGIIMAELSDKLKEIK